MAGTQAPAVVVPPAGTPAAPAAAQPAPVPTYTVKRGDTLHQIALDSGLDYRDLAAWNNIENVNVIRVGQVLRLAAPGETAVTQDAAVAGAGGVVTTPLRTGSPIVESGSGVSSAGAPSSTQSAGTGAGTTGSGTAGASGNAASVAAAPTSAGRASDASLKTGPKAIKEPYSDQAVRELTLAASAVPAPTEKLAMAQPGGVRSEPATAPRSEAKAEPGSPVTSAPPAASSPILGPTRHPTPSPWPDAASPATARARKDV